MRRVFDRWTRYYQQLLAPDSLPTSWQIILLVLILVIVFVVRIVTISTPALDETAWKEIDYLMISQNYWQNGYNFFQPEVSWPAEPPRVTEMEIPLVPYAAALLYKPLGYNVYTARAITLFSFLLLIVYVFKLTKRELGPYVAVTSAFVAGMIPLYQPFGRFLFTEPLMIAMSVAALYYVAEWIDNKNRRDGVLAWLTLTLTIALKLEALYLFLPILWIAYRKYGINLKRYKIFLVLVVLALILPVLWYAYAYYLENTGAHLFGIFKGHNKSQTLRMITDLRWYRTMAGRIINQILSGMAVTIIAILGLLSGIRLRRAGLFFVYLIAIGVYFILVAEGQIDAPYRQMTSIPALSIFVAMGAIAIVLAILAIIHSLRETVVLSTRQIQVSLIICFILLALIPLRKLDTITASFSPVHWEQWTMAQEIKRHTDETSKLVVTGEYTIHVGGYDLSPVIYHYTGLQGWTLTAETLTVEQIELLINRGATHFVRVPPYGDPNSFINLQEADTTPIIEALKLEYPTLNEGENGILLDLNASASE